MDHIITFFIDIIRSQNHQKKLKSTLIADSNQTTPSYSPLPYQIHPQMDCVKQATLSIIKDDNKGAFDVFLHNTTNHTNIDDIMIDVTPSTKMSIASVVLEHASVECMRLLVDKYNIGIKHKSILTSTLFKACLKYQQCLDYKGKRKYSKIIRILINGKNKINCDFANIEGITCLMCICGEQYASTSMFNDDRIRIIKLLLENGANLSSIDAGGNTALSLAKRDGQYSSDIVEFLESYIKNTVQSINPIINNPIEPALMTESSQSVPESINPIISNPIEQTSQPVPKSNPIINNPIVPSLATESNTHDARKRALIESIELAELEIKLLTLQERQAAITVNISNLKLQAAKANISLATETATLANFNRMSSSSEVE